MNVDSGTPLYLQVEEALKDFQSGVARLKTQQGLTDALLSEGNKALENLVHQIARIDKMREQVESDLRLLERFREKTCKEITDMKSKIQMDLSQHELHTQGALDNIRTDLKVRRQELLGLIQDLRTNLQSIEQSNSDSKTILTRALTTQKEEISKTLSNFEHKLQSCTGQQEDCIARLENLERRNKYLGWTTALVAVIVLAAILLT